MDDGRLAQAAAAQLRLQAVAGPEAILLGPVQRSPSQDPVQRAAHSARGIISKSARSERVAATLCGTGSAAHIDLLAALEAAAIDPKRAEAEVVRMLSMDLLMEPRAGQYRWIEDRER